MRSVFDRLTCVLTMFAFILAMSVQAIPSAEALGIAAPAVSTMMDEHCPRMALEHPERGAPKPIPCRGLMPDCVKQMGCIGSPNLPSRSDELRGPASYSAVVYSRPAESSTGLSIEPDLFPPIGS